MAVHRLQIISSKLLLYWLCLEMCSLCSSIWDDVVNNTVGKMGRY